MPPYLPPLFIVEAALPARCEPANELLHWISASFHTCIPTNLALLSTLLGMCSIVSWLFAQLPQIYKIHKAQSASGISFGFLLIWLFGDLTNLLGCIFTQQALWQVVVAGYYVLVDCALDSQWIWYELLNHGRPLRSIWSRPSSPEEEGLRYRAPRMQEIWDNDSGGSSADEATSPIYARYSDNDTPPSSLGRSIPNRPNPMDAFRIPNFARSPSSFKDSSSLQNTPASGSAPNRTIHRLGNSSSPMPSPKTVLYIALVLAILSNTSTATPLSPFAPSLFQVSSPPVRSSGARTSSSPAEIAGTILSWMSTISYLGSRIPQLVKNHVRKSTEGLSLALFVAAFFGNFFYSTSILTNPCAWNTYAPGEGAGWVDPEGSIQSEWILRAAPFFLGAAGVLILDGTMGLQFWYLGDGTERGRSKGRDEDVIVIVNEDGVRRKRRLRWRRVSGWMRGWQPSVSVAATPNPSRAATPAPSARGASPSPSTDSARYERGALDEARALLGTEVTSPREYGGVS